MAQTSHRLVRLRIIGGFLDGFDFSFSDKLNCIIGARGTGKTTVLELIRYALNVMPTDPKKQKELISLVESNLNGGRVELTVETANGITYIISRNIGENPEVYNPDHAGTGITYTPNIFRLDIFSQNEIESIAGQNTCQMALIESFTQNEMHRLNAEIIQIRKSLEANSASILPLREREKQLDEDLNLLPELKKKLDEFAADSTKESAELNVAHEQKNIRSMERNFLESSEKIFKDVAGRLTPMKDAVAEMLRWCKTAELTHGENYDLIRQMYDEVASNNTTLNRAIDTYIQSLRESYLRYLTAKKELFTRQQNQEVKYHALVEKSKEEQARAADRRKISDQYTRLLAAQNELGELRSKINGILKDRSDLKNTLTMKQDTRYNIRRKIADEINRNLAPNIRVTITQFGCRDIYFELLVNALRGTQMQYKQVAAAIVRHIDPVGLARLVSAKDTDGLHTGAGINPNQANLVVATLNTPEILSALDIVEMPDTAKIELNDHGTYKPSDTLSTGQKCNAILPILLLDSERPLLIDQPEDNLDNEFVHNIIVESVRNVKNNRQLIFVTHNPNIPVLGEAERMLVMESDGTAGHIRKSGTVDDCKENIISILEGGAEAFRKRVERYSH